MEQSRISRRNALRAGAAIGVGAAAWSAPNITSLGFTPAYAQTCSNFTVNESVKDRNTNQASPCQTAGGSLQYSSIDMNALLGAGYTLNMPPNNYCNNARFNTQLVFPAGQTCAVTIRVHDNGNFDTGPYNFNNTFGPTATSPLPVYVPAVSDYSGTSIPNARWSVEVQCVATADAGCL